MKALAAVLTAVLLLACGEAPVRDQSSEPASADSAAMPPGFLDEPPPQPKSNTLVLSGGDLVLDTVTTDAVVVIQNGKLLAWGKRGEVDMPNDSIGTDMRGKWITPGFTADITATNLPHLALMQVGEPANLLAFTLGPDLSQAGEADLHAVVSDGRLEVFGAKPE